MDSVTLIILLIATYFIYTILTSYIRQYRERKHLELDHIYEKMELDLIQHNLRLGMKEIDFIKSYKTVAKNPEFLDIQVLLGIAISMGEKEIDKILNKKTPEDLELTETFWELEHQFQNLGKEIVLLSVLHRDFLLFVFQNILVKAFTLNLRNMKNRWHRIKSIIQAEFAILSQSQHINGLNHG